MAFSSFDFPSYIVITLNELGFKTPTSIQHEVFPIVSKGEDLLAVAKTGSGKTLAFLLPILSKINTFHDKDYRSPQVLVLSPTRELAAQINDVLQLFVKASPNRIQSTAVFGGVSINPQKKAVTQANFLIATPGRLIELVEENAVDLMKVEVLVIDEADRILSLGFKDEMLKLLSFLPKKRQNLLFSATLDEGIEEINGLYLNDPQIIKIQDEEQDIDLIEQKAYMVTEERKGPLLRYIIRKFQYKQVLIFTSSIRKADNLVVKLRRNGIEAEAIHSKKSQGARTEALRRFKSAENCVLVATDLIARGIDIEYLPCVINYELPRSPKDYIHRIGRTGRANAHGEAISLVTPADKNHFRVIQKKMGKWVESIDCSRLDLEDL